MSDYYKPLTYAPKIEAVLRGECKQTIRYHKPGKKMPMVGDTLTMFTWSGKPYRSPWGTRTKFALEGPYALRLYIYEGEGSLWYCEPKKEMVPGWMLYQIAAADGIAPPTGEELITVLLGMLKGKPLVYDDVAKRYYYPLVVWR